MPNPSNWRAELERSRERQDLQFAEFEGAIAELEPNARILISAALREELEEVVSVPRTTRPLVDTLFLARA